MKPTIDGQVSARFEPVRRCFEENFQRHCELGASFAVTLDGSVAHAGVV